LFHHAKNPPTTATTATTFSTAENGTWISWLYVFQTAQIQSSKSSLLMIACTSSLTSPCQCQEVHTIPCLNPILQYCHALCIR
jgi:hypothetical protein